MRDITLADTIYILFSTRAFATGIPGTLGGTPVVSAYENDSATQITAGITLGVDHDSVTGLNLLTIVATGANGYENGKDYSLIITTGTVDSVSVVGEVVGSFTIGRSAASVDLANGTDGLGALKVLIDTVDTVVDGIQTDLDNGTDGLGALKALIDTIDDFLDTEIAAITAAVITNAAGADIAADIIALKAETVLIVADTGELQTDWINGGRLDLILDIIAADVISIDGAAMRGTDNAALASVLGALADAAAAGDPTSADTVMQYAKQLINILIGTAGVVTFPAEAAPANAVSLAQVIRAIHTDTGTTLDGKLPSALIGGRMDSDMEAINNDTESAIDLKASAKTIVRGTVDTATFTPTTTQFEVDDITEATADHFNGRIWIWTSGALKDQATDITDYELANGKGKFTVTALTEVAANNDTGIIV